MIRFDEANVRPMGRTARGVRGMKLPEGAKVIQMIVAEENGSVLTATENGYGKRTSMEDHPLRGRGGQGVISIQMSERNGAVVSAVPVIDGDEVMLISKGGTLIRTGVDDIRVMGRNTQGVRLIKLDDGETLVGLQRIVEIEDDEDELLDGEELDTEATEAPESGESEQNDEAGDEE